MRGSSLRAGVLAVLLAGMPGWGFAGASAGEAGQTAPLTPKRPAAKAKPKPKPKPKAAAKAKASAKAKAAARAKAKSKAKPAPRETAAARSAREARETKDATAAELAWARMLARQSQSPPILGAPAAVAVTPSGAVTPPTTVPDRAVTVIPATPPTTSPAAPPATVVVQAPTPTPPVAAPAAPKPQAPAIPQVAQTPAALPAATTVSAAPTPKATPVPTATPAPKTPRPAAAQAVAAPVPAAPVSAAPAPVQVTPVPPPPPPPTKAERAAAAKAARAAAALAAAEAAAQAATRNAAPPAPRPVARPGASAVLPPNSVFGYADFAAQRKLDAAFLAVPDAALAGEHLKTLTAAPHWASSPEDLKTAQYVAAKFQAAGLQTEIVPFNVWMNKPLKIEITAKDEAGHTLMTGPTPEHVDPKAWGGDAYQNDERILPAFNGSSPSGDVTADVVYANYGTLADFQRLAELGVSVKGKIVIVRYGANFRGVKVYIAQQQGAVGVLIYSDPADDGYMRGDVYPRGPYRPETAVQRGSVQFLPIYAGDPSTPGVGAAVDLPDSARLTDPARMNQPSIPANPLSYKDAAPILQALNGKPTPREWQGALPFTYHLGGEGGVKVHMLLDQQYRLRTIWDVIGRIPGTDDRDWVIAGNHRDAWVYGAVDPNSGTAAMLETVHGLGALLKKGWKPKRTIIVASWDAEEEGLIGSTEWVESHAGELAHAVAYFNMDVGVSGPAFTASAVPSLKEFIREVTREVPSPKGGTVYEQWKADQEENDRRRGFGQESESNPFAAAAVTAAAVRVGDLGSGSDYTPFLQHLGVPSTDVGSDGPYGVYHSTFDDYNWFVKFADPTFVYEQQQARIFGLELLHMADADVLPYDYRLYGRTVVGYVDQARRHSESARMNVDFTKAEAAARRFAAAGEFIYSEQVNPAQIADPAQLNAALREAETALLNPAGLPHRSWYKHTIYDPGEYTGYAAVVIPGVTEALDADDAPRAQEQLEQLAAALNRAAVVLEQAAGAPAPVTAPPLPEPPAQ